MKEKTTLADFTVPIPLRCFHCGALLPKKTPAELNRGYVIARCLKCQCMTPFKLEQSA